MTSDVFPLMFLSAKYPEMQERVSSEVTNVASEVDLATLESIRRLTYLSRVTKEVLRLEPAAGFYSRGALRDTVVQGKAVLNGDTAVQRKAVC